MNFGILKKVKQRPYGTYMEGTYKGLKIEVYDAYKYNQFLIYVSRNIFHSPTNLKNRPKSFRNNIETETEPNKYILNINGQKIFSTPSFTSLTTRNRVLSSSRLDSELYRNYHELKLKEEEISKRKNKKNKDNNSHEQKIRKDKRIDEKVLNIIYSNRNKDKKIFQNGKTDFKINVIKNNFIYNNKHSKNAIPLRTVQDNKTRNKVNKNLLFFKGKKSTDNIKVNSNIIDKKLTENINLISFQISLKKYIKSMGKIQQF